MFSYIFIQKPEWTPYTCFDRMESRDKLPSHEYENVRTVLCGGEATARDTLPIHEYENVRMGSDGGEATG